MVTRVAVNKISLEARHQLHISSTIKYEITCTGNTDNCSRWVQVCIWHSAWFENWSATVLSKSNITSQIQDAHVHFGQWLGLFGLQPANQGANTVCLCQSQGFVLATVKCEFTFLLARQVTNGTSKSAGYPLLACWMHHACISFTWTWPALLPLRMCMLVTNIEYNEGIFVADVTSL